MTAAVLTFERQTKGAKLRCTACGKPCPCGAPFEYIPAREIAAKAIEANPEKSDRAIAADTAVSNPTVAAARKLATGKYFPVEKRSAEEAPKAGSARFDAQPTVNDP